MAEPAATTKTTTAGIYCKACGYDLRASKEAGRCPECGRAFSPENPKTSRPRPFAAEWKRALVRWVRRGAILLLVLALLLGGLWGWLYWGWKQEQAVLAQTRGEEDTLARVILGGEPGRWAHDRPLPGSFILERVGGIYLPDTATDADLLPLRKLAELKDLRVTGAITDAGMAHLRQCPRLRVLWISGPRTTDAGLAALRDLPRLEELYLPHASFTDAGLAALATLPELQSLELSRTPLTDAGLVYLAPLGKLRHLYLEGTRVTDAGLVRLEKSRALESLILGGTQVTDAGLVQLEKLRALKYLSLRDTQVTPAGVAKLRAALPGCAIVGP